MEEDQKLYTETFSQVHSSITFNKEELEMNRELRRKAVKRMGITAASLAVILGIGASVYASHFFGLHDLIINKGGSPSPVVTSSVSADPTDEPVDYTNGDTISLAGWADSKEGKAVSEWTAFVDSYDQDGKILAEVGNDPTGFEEKYGLYYVYSQEMADKFDEIIEKYDLKMHKSMDTFDNNRELTARIGGKLLKGGNKCCGGYIYNDGSFAYDGEATLKNGKLVNYQFSNLKKGVFTDTTLGIGDSKDYEEWNYKTKCGVNVYLALSSTKALIITERKNSFVAVNVLAGTEEGFLDGDDTINRKDLEKMADTFNYTILK